MRISPEAARSLGLVQDAKGNWGNGPAIHPSSVFPNIEIATPKKRIRQSGKPLKHENKTDRPLPNTVAQRDQTPALDGAVPGEAQGVGRTRIRFTGYRVRPLDPDNFAGSIKDLLDGLRHAGLIPGDEPWRIILETEQVRVGGFAAECTEIEITQLP